MSKNKTIVVVGGPIVQKIDPVLSIVPSGNGQLAEDIARELEKSFSVKRIGSFPGGKNCDFDELQSRLAEMIGGAEAIIFMAHLPNILAKYSQEKIRVQPGETGQIKFRAAEKLVENIKQKHTKSLLIPFKLADQTMTKVEIIRWMLKLHSGLAVYSRLGDSLQYWIIDVFGNETPVKRSELPIVLSAELTRHLSAVRRGSCFDGEEGVSVPHFHAFQNFAAEAAGAFVQLTEKNVESGRWPGNLSSRQDETSFVITKRNIDKQELGERDFVSVAMNLDENNCLLFRGEKGLKPSIDTPVHRIIYTHLPWVRHIVHGHKELKAHPFVHADSIPRWPCGAENEGLEIVEAAPKTDIPPLWAVNIAGHGFVALISEKCPVEALKILATCLND